jgi:hypothetical protein
MTKMATTRTEVIFFTDNSYQNGSLVFCDMVWIVGSVLSQKIVSRLSRWELPVIGHSSRKS